MKNVHISSTFIGVGSFILSFAVLLFTSLSTHFFFFILFSFFIPVFVLSETKEDFSGSTIHKKKYTLFLA